MSQHAAHDSINLFMPSQGSQKLAVLKEEWLACAGVWKSSALYKKMKQSSKTSNHGARLWLTKTQIAAKYSSMEVAQAIVDAKLADAELRESQVREHKDCPGNQARYCGGVCVFYPSSFLKMVLNS